MSCDTCLFVRTKNGRARTTILFNNSMVSVCSCKTQRQKRLHRTLLFKLFSMSWCDLYIYSVLARTSPTGMSKVVLGMISCSRSCSACALYEIVLTWFDSFGVCCACCNIWKTYMFFLRWKRSRWWGFLSFFAWVIHSKYRISILYPFCST